VVRGLVSPRRLLARLRGEAGIALPFALITMLATGTLASSAIAYSSWNYGSSKRSDAEQVAFALAEAGLNYAYSTLYNSGTPTMDNAVPPRTITLSTGDASYYGTLDGDTWKLVGVGTVRNPTGPGSQPVVRTVSGRARLGSARRGSSNNAVWNYVYVDDPTVTTVLGNSVDVNIPLYVRGNLTLANSAQVSGYSLQVGGTLEFQNLAHVGTAETPIHEAHVGGGCRIGSAGAFVSPCGPDQRVYATISDATQTTFEKPPVDPNWYFNAKPGPRHPCTVGSFPGGFDNDATPNNSRAVVNLTPSTGYDCRVYDADGNLEGQLTWVPGSSGPGTLTMHGTIYFDGPIEFRQYNNAVYQGRATIHAAGDIIFANQSTLCGDPQCDADWDPQQNLLAFVSGANVRVGQQSNFQGAIYATLDYTEQNNSTFWGPIIARRVQLANSTVNHYVPIGTLMPGMPATYEDVVTITNEPGSWG
jgi:Tfp pilus assembly protein PilX